MAVEYAAVRQLIQMMCANCHTKQTINPAVEDEVRSIEGWLKVQKSSGETFAYCELKCLQAGAYKLRPPSGIEVVGG